MRVRGERARGLAAGPSRTRRLLDAARFAAALRSQALVELGVEDGSELHGALGSRLRRRRRVRGQGVLGRVRLAEPGRHEVHQGRERAAGRLGDPQALRPAVAHEEPARVRVLDRLELQVREQDLVRALASARRLCYDAGGARSLRAGTRAQKASHWSVGRPQRRGAGCNFSDTKTSWFRMRASVASPSAYWDPAGPPTPSVSTSARAKSASRARFSCATSDSNCTSRAIALSNLEEIVDNFSVMKPSSDLAISFSSFTFDKSETVLFNSSFSSINFFESACDCSSSS